MPSRSSSLNTRVQVHEINSISAKSVLFCDWFYCEKDQLWVEHGNQYDAINTSATRKPRSRDR